MNDHVVTDERWLKSTDDIVEYFEDAGYEYLPCGQGYFTREAGVFVGIADKYYRVTLKGEIESEKRDRGDRLYWVENIISVTFVEVSAETVRYAVQDGILTQLGILHQKMSALHLTIAHIRDTIK